MLVSKSQVFVLFSSKRVCCYCCARHNADLNLGGTESESAIKLCFILYYMESNIIMFKLKKIIFFHPLLTDKEQYVFAAPKSFVCKFFPDKACFSAFKKAEKQVIFPFSPSHLRNKCRRTNVLLHLGYSLCSYKASVEF